VTDVVRVISVAGRVPGSPGRLPAGTVWVVPVERLVRVRTQERGEAAL